MKALLISLILLIPASGAESKYDPSRVAGKVETRLVSFKYGEREVPLKIYLPEARKAAPVILLSHGLGGSREVGGYLGSHWAARGYLVVAMQHAGSDESVWKGKPASGRMAAMKQAASPASFLNRVRDVPATLDQLQAWNTGKKHFLKGRMKLEKVGMSGHSFGAVTTQALSGQRFRAGGASFADPRIDAALALSPSVPKHGDAELAFGKITLPMMLMTGSRDSSRFSDNTPESRRKVFAALPAGSKYELVLKDAEHMAFSDRSARGEEQRNPNHHRVILAFSTAFWDASLGNEPAARKWLKSGSAKALLQPGDLWQSK